MTVGVIMTGRTVRGALQHQYHGQSAPDMRAGGKGVTPKAGMNPEVPFLGIQLIAV